MKPTAEELLREFAEKWSLDEYAEITLDGFRKKECLSDLNALLDKLMPTEEDMENEIDKSPIDMVYAGGFRDACKWFRSRMKGGEK